MKRVVVFLAVLFFPSFILGGVYVKKPIVAITGTVIKVKDGDTIVVSPKEKVEITCRLYGIDTPETPKKGKPGQSFGEEAEKELRQLVFGQVVKAALVGKEVYGRDLCLIQKNNLDVNLEMIKRGYAWAYVRYLKRAYASEYLEAEKTAREKKLGIWQDRNPEPPWEFRKRTKKHKKITITR